MLKIVFETFCSFKAVISQAVDTSEDHSALANENAEVETAIVAKMSVLVIASRPISYKIITGYLKHDEENQ